MITICGTSLAGLRVAAELREAGYTGHLRTIDRDPHPPYDRPPLTKDLLGTYVRPLSAEGLGNLAELSDEHICATITDISPGRVVTSGGTFDTDIIVVALGAEPRRTIEGALTLRTRDDAEAIRRHLTDEVTIVGGGWLGCELAATLAPSHTVTLIEQQGHLLVPEISDWITTVLTDLGVEVRLGSSCNGAFGLVIDATGAVPSPFARQTDGWGRTSDPTIFALGDAAQWNGQNLAGHWTAALHQAPLVARAVLADSELPEPQPITPEVFSTIGPAEIMMIGEAAGTPVVVSDESRYRCLWVDDDHLLGGLVANRPADVAALRKNLGAKLTTGRASEDLPLKKLLR